jgi:hypothetical protein
MAFSLSLKSSSDPFLYDDSYLLPSPLLLVSSLNELPLIVFLWLN